LTGLLVGTIVLFLPFSRGQAAPIPIGSPGNSAEIPRTCLTVDAESYLDRHKWAEARDCYTEIIKKESGSVSLWVGLATSLTYLGHREEALRQLSQAVENVKNSQKPQLIARVRVLSRLFLTNTTFQTFQDGLILLNGRKFKASQEKFEKALNEEVDNVEVLLRLGQSTLLDGKVKEALNHLKRAKQLDPFDPEIRLWLGRVYQSGGNSQEAQIELKEAYSSYYLLKAHENSEAAAVWYAEALINAGQGSAALKVLTQDSRMNTSHVQSLLTAAKIRTQISKFDGSSWRLARQDLRLALKRLEQVKLAHSGGVSQIQDIQGNLSITQDKTLEEIKADILGFLREIDQLRPLRRS
jgi:tetratricopeptide (TPR) repeat protein